MKIEIIEYYSENIKTVFYSRTKEAPETNVIIGVIKNELQKRIRGMLGVDFETIVGVNCTIDEYGFVKFLVADACIKYYTHKGDHCTVQCKDWDTVRGRAVNQYPEDYVFDTEQIVFDLNQDLKREYQSLISDLTKSGVLDLTKYNYYSIIWSIADKQQIDTWYLESAIKIQLVEVLKKYGYTDITMDFPFEIGIDDCTPPLQIYKLYMGGVQHIVKTKLEYDTVYVVYGPFTSEVKNILELIINIVEKVKEDYVKENR